MRVRPTLDAILAILHEHVEIDRETGVVRDRSRPRDHHHDVPARDHPLLALWHLLGRGRVTGPDGSVAIARGRDALERLADALAMTMPLVHVLLTDGPADQAGRWLEAFHGRVEAIRARASSEMVLDEIDREAERRLVAAPDAELARRLAAAVTLDGGPLGSRGAARGGLVGLGLAMCFRAMQQAARAVHAAAVRLEAARAAGPALADPELARALAGQTEGLRRNLRDFHLAPYLARTGVAGALHDPGTHPPLRARFAAVRAAPLATDDEFVAAAALFLATVAACLEDARAIADEVIAAGGAGQRRRG